MKNSIYLKSLLCQETDRYPVWIMRQAGRYMSVYRELRKKYSFNELLYTPELSAEITLQPIKKFGYDAAILFSDILVTAKALGSDLEFIEGKGPIIHNHIESESDIQGVLPVETTESFDPIIQAIHIIKKELEPYKTPLIGFCGSPFTVSSYMLSPGFGHDEKTVKKWMYQSPESYHQLLDKLANVTIHYATQQIKAGVQAFQIFDSWSSILTWRQFNEFSLPYIEKIVNALKHHNIPLIVFGMGNSVFYPLISKLDINAIGFDWTANIPQLRKKLPKDLALQGNIDPFLLFTDPKTIQKETLKHLDSLNKADGIIINLGHGIKPTTPEDNVKAFVDTIQSYQK